jgi:hypothetical protein
MAAHDLVAEPGVQASGISIHEVDVNGRSCRAARQTSPLRSPPEGRPDALVAVMLVDFGTVDPGVRWIATAGPADADDSDDDAVEAGDEKVVAAIHRVTHAKDGSITVWEDGEDPRQVVGARVVDRHVARHASRMTGEPFADERSFRISSKCRGPPRRTRDSETHTARLGAPTPGRSPARWVGDTWRW